MALNPLPDSPIFLTTEDVARLLNISPRTVCLWAELGKLPAVKIGKLWRFPAARSNGISGIFPREMREVSYTWPSRFLPDLNLLQIIFMGLRENGA
jgi:excisionase family DNA binding protein